MIGSVEDVEKAVLDESQRRLPPARIEAYEPRIAGQLEGADSAGGHYESKHRFYPNAEPREC